MKTKPANRTLGVLESVILICGLLAFAVAFGALLTAFNVPVAG